VNPREPAEESCSPERPAARRIADVTARQRVSVCGTIRQAEAVTIGSSPAYRCVLSDDTGELCVIFLGRSAVTGLLVGTRCHVEGMIGVRDGRLVLWNPPYRLAPPGGPAAGGTTAAAT
jgi:RecG-like helicase